jgi:hypothetical protein
VARASRSRHQSHDSAAFTSVSYEPGVKVKVNLFSAESISIRLDISWSCPGGDRNRLQCPSGSTSDFSFTPLLHPEPLTIRVYSPRWSSLEDTDVLTSHTTTFRSFYHFKLDKTHYLEHLTTWLSHPTKGLPLPSKTVYCTRNPRTVISQRSTLLVDLLNTIIALL